MSINPTNPVSAPVSTPDATNKPTLPISSSKNDTVKDTIDLKKTGCFEAFAKAICDFFRCLLNRICCRSPQPEQNDTVKDTVKPPPQPPKDTDKDTIKDTVEPPPLLPPVWPIPVTPGQEPPKDFEDAVSSLKEQEVTKSEEGIEEAVTYDPPRRPINRFPTVEECLAADAPLVTLGLLPNPYIK